MTRTRSAPEHWSQPLGPRFLYRETTTRLLPPGVRGMAVSRRRILLHPVRGTDHTRCHEVQHLRQYRRAGLLWPLHYLWRFVRAGFSYRRNEWEVMARQVAQATAFTGHTRAVE